MHEQIYLIGHIFRSDIGCHSESGLALVGFSVCGWNKSWELTGAAALLALSLVASLS